jgi:hypothetical protein
MILQAILIIVAVCTFCYYKLTKNREYWSKHGVTNTGFKFFWGDDIFMSTGEPIHDFALRMYKDYPNKPYIGTWSVFGSPVLMIQNDFELIKSIWIKDFDHFMIAMSFVKNHKDIWPATRNEKMMIHHVQSAQGDEWKNIR